VRIAYMCVCECVCVCVCVYVYIMRARETCEGFRRGVHTCVCVCVCVMRERGRPARGFGADSKLVTFHFVLLALLVQKRPARGFGADSEVVTFPGLFILDD
jgi:hypothetical protein